MEITKFNSLPILHSTFYNLYSAFLPYEKLMPYAEGKDKHSTPKGHYRNFAKALALADRLI
jgi:hypothetical protein